MKGIVLAGGTGSRLLPCTQVITKHLLPVYDKPLIFYPISTLMLAGIRSILIITTERDLNLFKQLLGDGSRFGVDFQFLVQPEPRGIAQAFLIGKEFINGEEVCLVLGDNLFYGVGMGGQLKTFKDLKKAQIFGYRVNDPSAYGVAVIDEYLRIEELVEKPSSMISNWAVPGLYFYPGDVVDVANNLAPGIRGELEITDLNKVYLEDGRLEINLLERGTVWLDTGTPQLLQAASEFIKVLDERQGLKIGCLEEIAMKNGWITAEEVAHQAKIYGHSDYGKYLLGIASNS